MNRSQETTMADDDPQVVSAVRQYLEELEAGRRPDRFAFQSRFPHLNQDLTPYLDALDLMHAAAPLLQPTSGEKPVPADGLCPEPLGDFRIVREIGRGGMGVVYEAVQTSLGRRVALKVLPFAAALDAKQLQRFKNEAQAAAHLHHQHIVPVYAVGVERGVHYYAMQLIEGQNLAALIDTLRDSATITEGRPDDKSLLAPSNTLSPAHFSTQRSHHRGDFFNTVARLGAQAAEGLDYAHALGIVHRDIKPANLLVDGRGVLWITDFGLAQFHADVGLTQTGDLLGTLRYMSPEQAGGQRLLLDHRADVYSLGATLYELLTLRAIFDGRDRQSLLRQILQDEPRPPRSLDRSIPAELETIVLKATNKLPAERYATAGEMADDLQRFLRHEPIRAKRTNLVQRGRKWLRRHPAVMAAAVVLLILLTAGSLLGAWLIRGEQAKTRTALEREQRHAAEAQEQFLLARRAVDQMIYLADQEMADQPHLEKARKELLEAALIYYEEFIAQHQEDPVAQKELEETKRRVKQILDDLAVLQGDRQLLLLNRTAIREDLGLTPEQRRQIGELSSHQADAWQKSPGFFRLSPEQRRQRFLDQAKANETAVKAILRADQLARFRQITLQVRGPSAFRDPEIIEHLKLTAGQRDQIRAIEAEAFLGLSEVKAPFGPPEKKGHFGPPGGKELEELKAQEQTIRAARERIMAVLTEEQTQRWRLIAGEPLDRLDYILSTPFRTRGPK